MARQDLKLVGVNVEPDVHAALSEFAAEHDLPLSVAARMLLRKALEGEGAELVALDLGDAGFVEGVRRGIAKVHKHMALLFKDFSEGR